MPRLFTLTAALALCLCLRAEDTAQRIFDPAFHTLKVQVDGDFMAPPVINLGDGRQICISFDEAGTDRSYLRYSLTHCNADWQPSDLLETEYLASFNEAEVSDCAYSSGVFRPYVNYRICLPGQDMQMLQSGNYLLRVWREGEDPDTPVLQARFSVCDPQLLISGDVSALTDRGANDTWQQLSLAVDCGDYQVRDPYSELTVKIMQNGIESPADTPLRPLRLEGRRLIYEHSPALLFRAGNEFRRFETVRTNYEGMHVDSSLYDTDGYRAVLTADTERASHPYLYDQTQFGRYKIDEYSATDPDLGADYIVTDFTLDFPRLMDGQILLDGEFVRSLPLEQRVMDYDPATGKYHKSLLLKQGSYNYRYAALGKSGVLVPSLIEGDKFQTRNEYTIYIYHRPFGARADKLIGTATIINQ